MPDKRKKIIINTGPILALTAALGDLNILEKLYKQVIVSYEVCQEILAGGPNGFAVKEFQQAKWLEKRNKPLDILPHLFNSLDLGEASVIQLALNEDIMNVCIDEDVGRRIARLNNLKVTGSIGVLVRARNEGFSFSMRKAIQKMKQHGVWLSDRVIEFALSQYT
jgi:predicted nucleic acid-binding protein